MIAVPAHKQAVTTRNFKTLEISKPRVRRVIVGFLFISSTGGALLVAQLRPSRFLETSLDIEFSLL